MFGTTFPDLRAIINENLETASWLFTATPAGFLLGSVLTGLLYEKYNKVVLLVVSILGAAGASAAVPWCTEFYLMLFVRFLYGSMAASLDTGMPQSLFSSLTLSQTTKLKEFSDDNFEFDEDGKKFFKSVENAVRKGEIARYEQFLLFPQCFQKTSTADT